MTTIKDNEGLIIAWHQYRHYSNCLDVMAEHFALRAEQYDFLSALPFGGRAVCLNAINKIGDDITSRLDLHGPLFWPGYQQRAQSYLFDLAMLEQRLRVFEDVLHECKIQGGKSK